MPLPTYMTENAAGMDLYANVHDELTIEKGSVAAVPAGIMIALPNNYEAQIRSRSGLAYKNGITMANGVGTIDADYRGEIKVLLMNLGKEEFTIKRGDRIAQMVINKVEIVNWEQVDNLDETDRGKGGFGHTGI